jgi:peptidoglycan/xylan/chitin deacetylase (PgdA/CDA1 family)
MSTKTGTLVISLDFELLWGIRDLETTNKHTEILLTRQVVPKLLDIFKKYDVHATWATVGFLFFESRDELLAALPNSLPAYSNKTLSPYDSLSAEVGINEGEDLLHYAPSLIREIMAVPHQELATHTFSHYYCLEDGQSPSDFEDDLQSAMRAAEKYNQKIESIVFPRNQYATPYLEVCAQNGIQAFRGNESVWFRRTSKRESHRQWLRRLMRLMDAYINISGTNAYLLPVETSLPVNLPASRYLRPYSRRLRVFEPLRLNRILSSMTTAAQAGHIFHLWWHPEDFSSNMDANLLFLEKVLIKYKELRQLYGMQSLTMAEISHQVLIRK